MFGTFSFGNPFAVAASADNNAVAPVTQQVARTSSATDNQRNTSEARRTRENFDLDHVYVPIDPDVRAYQSTFDLDTRLAERLFDPRRAWDHVTLDDVAREMDDLKMDKDVDEQILTQIKTCFEHLTQETVMRSEKDKKRLTPARLTEIEKRLRDDPSLQDEYDDTLAPVEAFDGHAAAEVKKKLVRTYAKIKKNTSLNLSQPTVHNIENRISILRDK